MGEDTKVILVLVEENDDSFLGLEIGGNEDGDIGGGFWGVEGEAYFGEVVGGEAIGDNFADCFCLE